MPTARGIRAGAAYVELYANDSRLVRGLKRAQARLRAFSASVREAGFRLVKLSAVFATPFIAGVKVFADFEQQMASVATMLDRPEKHMARFRKGIRDMAVEFGESTEALAGGLYDILSASVPAEKALDVLAVAARAAKAGLTDTKTAADAITTVLNAYGLSAENAGDVSDLLFSIVKRGKTTFAEIAPAIGMVATTAATAGVSLDELGSALATMTRNGVRTENAVTALNAIISAFLKPTDEAAEYARTLGFEMSSATIKSEGLAGVFARISKLPPDAISKLFPNVRALRGVLPALKNMEGFIEDMGAMGARAGATETAYARMTRSLSHSFRQLKQSALAALSVIGEALAEPMSKAAAAIKRWARNIRELVEKNKGLVIAAAKVVAIIGLVGGALVAAGAAGSMMAFVFGGIASIISAVGTALGMLGSILAAILSPIGLVITGMAALAAYILYATGAGAKALGWLGEKFDILKETALKAWKGIGDALAAGDIALAAKVLWLSMKMEWTRGINFLEKAWLNFRNFFIKIGCDAWHGLLATVEVVWHALEVGWIETTAFLSKTWTRFTGWVAKAWHWVGKQLSKAWNWMRKQFDSSFDAEAANRAADEYYEAKKAQIERETGRKLAEREERRRRERERASRVHEGTMAEIGRENLRKHQELDAEYKRRLAENEADLAKARAEWDAAIAEAGRKRTEAEREAGGPGRPEEPKASAPEIVEKLKAQLAGIATTIEGAAKKALDVDIVGTFSAEAADRMGLSANVAERTAKATEETAKNTKRIVQKMGQAQLVFE